VASVIATKGSKPRSHQSLFPSV